MTNTLKADGLIAYTHFTDRYWQIWIMDEDGNNQRQITKDPGDKRNPLFINGGEQIIYETNSGELYKINLDGTGKERLFKQLPYMNGTDIATDGKTLGIAVFRSDTQDLSNIWIAHLEQPDSPRRITDKIGVVRSPRWHPEGNKILYTVYRKGETEKIYLLDLDTGKTETILDDQFNNIYASFSPDGGKIIYASDKNGNYDIWIMDIEVKDTKAITAWHGLDTLPCWSSDSKKIIYVSNKTGNLQLWEMEADGSGKKQLTYEKNPSKDPVYIKK